MKATTSTLYLRSPAKINLSLVVLGKRPDGYHELLTEMIMVDLYDDLVIEKVVDSGIHLRMSGRPVDGDPRDNLVVRALSQFTNAVLEKHPQKSLSGGFAVDLTKKIPVGAGLGGGSSNAAAVLWGANRMMGSPLEKDDLIVLCRGLGSDVPFFVGLPRAVGTGRGDQLRSLPPPLPGTILLWNPEISLPTASVYRSLDPATFEFSGLCELTENDRSTRINSLLNSGILINSLEEPAVRLCPKVGEGLRFLEKIRPGNTRMTGSGPTIFARFDSKDEAITVRRKMAEVLGGWSGVFQVLVQSPFPDI
jgi:4-diphosphocytidyl-2-C-methyl-D-erythritol kinase